MPTLFPRPAPNNPRFTWVRPLAPFEGFHEGLFVTGRRGFPLLYGKAYRVTEMLCDAPDLLAVYDWETSGSFEGTCHSVPASRLYRVTLDRDGNLQCDCCYSASGGRCRHCEATRALFGQLNEE